MKREIKVGLYTGRVYRWRKPKYSECCEIVTKEQLKDKNFMTMLQMKRNIMCFDCPGCSARKHEYAKRQRNITRTKRRAKQ